MSAFQSTQPAADNAMTTDVDALIALLNREIEAIERGDFQVVEDLLPSKSELFERFEQRQDDLGEALSGPGGDGLRDKVKTLKELAARDGELLELTRAAVDNIAAEIARIRDRHSLKGLYGKSGQHVAEGDAARQRIDRSV